MTLTGMLPLVILAVVLGAMLLSGRGASSNSAESTERDDPRNWIGPIYRNARDPNLFVPKRIGMGRTVNVARPLGKVLILGPIILALVIFVLGHR